MSTHVLIIDDDIELTELLTQYLEPEGFQVSCVHDGKSGIKRALSSPKNHPELPPIDAIILDVMLPKLNGIEVLKAIRDHLDTPILMLTARGDDIDRIIGLEIGADDRLHKAHGYICRCCSRTHQHRI